MSQEENRRNSFSDTDTWIQRLTRHPRVVDSVASGVMKSQPIYDIKYEQPGLIGEQEAMYGKNRVIVAECTANVHSINRIVPNCRNYTKK